MENQNDKIRAFFAEISEHSSEEFRTKVESQMSDDAIEIMCEHIEDFYGIEDDEQIGMLAQIMITGYLLGQSTKA